MLWFAIEEVDTMTGVLMEFLGSGGFLMLSGVVLVKLEMQRLNVLI